MTEREISQNLDLTGRSNVLLLRINKTKLFNGSEVQKSLYDLKLI